MEYFAYEEGVGTLKKDHAVKITEQEYLKALEAISNGKKISISNGFEIKEQPIALRYVSDGKLSQGYEIPDGAELYKEDEWYLNDGKYLKKDDKYELFIKKQNLLSKLDELDNATTFRTIREAALGNAAAIEKIKSVEAKAEELRKQLAELEA